MINKEVMMSGNRWYTLSCAALVVIALLTGPASLALAQAPVPGTAAAACYSQARADLGTVLPSGWHGYREQATCAQAAVGGAASRANAVPVLLPAAGSSPANGAACFRSLKQDLGTVLPGRYAIRNACAVR